MREKKAMQQYIIANWKMNGTRAEVEKLANSFLKKLKEATKPLPHVGLCPSFPYLSLVSDIVHDTTIEVGAQDCYPEKSGAFTGDVSISQILDVGCKYVIVGHSERRSIHAENSHLIHRKLESCIQAGLKPILCIGENEPEKESGQTLHKIEHQLLHDLPKTFNPNDLIIAYEPIWAIGTGKHPRHEEVEEVLGFIKHELRDRAAGGALVPVLYGGSVNEKNAQEFLDLPHNDGLLVGGASLKANEFWEIINASQR
jgi:triosephosphate isomerase